MIFLNRLLSLTKKKLMKTTENRPIPKFPKAEATEPITDVTEEMSNSFVIQSVKVCSILKP